MPKHHKIPESHSRTNSKPNNKEKFEVLARLEYSKWVVSFDEILALNKIYKFDLNFTIDFVINLYLKNSADF